MTPGPVEVQPPVPPKTTAQEDLTTAGQRRVNLIWEFTQSIIAVVVVVDSVVVASVLAVRGRSNDFPILLASLVMLVIGFYFSRTNHTAIGGVGRKPDQPPYEGR